ncbi:MAG: hypothetical protein ACI4NJ_03005 [Cellvibrio sp.]
MELNPFDAARLADRIYDIQNESDLSFLARFSFLKIHQESSSVVLN